MVAWKQWPTFLNGGTNVAGSRLVLWSWDATTPECKRLWPNSQVRWEAGGNGTQGRLSVHIPNCRVQSVAKLNTPIRATFQEIIVADWFGYRELTAHQSWYYLMNAINQVSRSSFDRTSRLGLRIRTCVLGVQRSGSVTPRVMQLLQQRPDQASRGEVIFRWAAQEYWVTCKKTIIIFLPIHYQSLLLSKSTGHVGRGTLHSEAKVSLKLH